MSGGIAAIGGLIALAVAAAFFFMRNRKAESKLPPPPQQVPRFPFDRWDILFSPNMPQQMKFDTETGLYTFTFPSADGVHYVVTTAPVLQIGKVVRMEFKIDGAGQIVPTQGSGDPPARVRLFMQRRGDNYTGAGPYEFYRWWSSASIVLNEAGDGFVLMAGIDKAQWTSVYGRAGDASAEATAGFLAALADCEHIGFTFGAMFAGHGNFAVNGNPVFSLKRFVID